MSNTIIEAIEEKTFFKDLRFKSEPRDVGGILRSTGKNLPNGESVTVFQFRASDSASAVTYGIRPERNKDVYIEFVFDLNNGWCVEIEISLDEEGGCISYREDFSSPQSGERYLETLHEDFFQGIQDRQKSFGDLLRDTFDSIKNALQCDTRQNGMPLPPTGP